MSTFLDLCTDSLSDIGQLGIGQSPSPEQTNQALRYANRMLQTWSTLKYYIYQTATRPFTLTAGLQDYTLGPTAAGPGSFVGARPVLVQSAQIRLPGSSLFLPLNMLSDDQWAAIRDKGATCSAQGLPQDLWVNEGYPNIDFHLWTVPNNACTISMLTWELLQQFATVFDTVNLPPGYERAVQKNLALELCSAYDMPPSAALQQQAADGLLRIQSVNAQAMGGALGESQTLATPNLSLPPQTGGQ